MTIRINDNASGVWKKAIGLTVTLTDAKFSPNRRAAQVQMPGSRSDTKGFKPGKKCWVPVKWLDGLTEPEVSSSRAEKLEPRRCPTCGHRLEDE